MENKQFEIKWKAEMYSEEEPMQLRLIGADFEEKYICPNIGAYNLRNLPQKIPEGEYTLEIEKVFSGTIKGRSESFRIVKAKRTAKNSIKPIRNNYAGRNVRYVKKLNVSSEYISIEIYDHGIVDGDIVSIYLNGIDIIKNYHLTHLTKRINIKLNKNIRNDLFLFAHNVGSRPPNTVAIRIIDDNKTSETVLNSNMQSCEAIIINVNK